MGYWLVARTQPRRENWAAENVMRQGCEFYLPKFELISARTREAKAVVLFPSYLFVFTANGQWRFLLGTFGIASVLMRGESPVPCPERYLAQMRGCEDADGFVVLPKRSRFAVNDKVMVTRGPFASKSGLWQGQTPAQRQQVLIEAMGGRIMVLIDVDSLEAA